MQSLQMEFKGFNIGMFYPFQSFMGCHAAAAKAFVAEVYMSIWGLDYQYNMHPECRFLPTKSEMYRNIIQGNYLIIYRISPNRVEVLRVFNSRVSITKIRTARRAKI
jgi:toxin ParE1/3/4